MRSKAEPLEDRFDSSKAGLFSAILEPRKARIYTEALVRIET